MSNLKANKNLKPKSVLCIDDLLLEVTIIIFVNYEFLFLFRLNFLSVSITTTEKF